jgi:hypothetical protein
MNRPGDLIGGIQRLKRATAELQRQWDVTRGQWQDQAARDFEAQYLETLMPTLRLVWSATGELEEQFRKAIQACQDRERTEMGD